MYRNKEIRYLGIFITKSIIKMLLRLLTLNDHITELLMLLHRKVGRVALNWS